VRARWVDSGKNASLGLSRLITAGGVSCGIDATFYLLDLTVGPELAATAAKVLDYQRRGDELQEDYIISESS
jgi:transcriptional regulator GlxA family with amidase domain